MGILLDLTKKQDELLAGLLFANDDEAIDINEQIELLKIDAKDIIGFLAGVYIEADVVAYGAEDFAKRATEKAKAARNHAAKLKELILKNMVDFGVAKVAHHSVSFSVRDTPPSVAFGDDFDLEKLPKEFTKTTIEPSKSSIKEALKAGVDVFGCFLSTKKALFTR